MKKLVFAVAAYNLAEVGRMVEIAKEARKAFQVEFIHYGGKFKNVIEEEGFKITRLEPALTEKKLKHIQTLLNGEGFNPMAYFTAREMEIRVKSEMDFYRKAKPDAIITGWSLTVGISARASHIHFINVLHSTSIREYYEAGLLSYPDSMDNWLLDILMPPEKRTAVFNKRVLTASIPMISYNKVLKKYGQKEMGCFIDYIEGDSTLLADIPQWVNHKKLRDNIHHIGALPAKLNVPVPEEVKKMDKKQPIVYFAMGSSGKKELIAEIIKGFEGKPYSVVAPIKGLVEEMQLQVPSNVIATGFLPAHIVNPMASVAVLHGGQNTVMNACLSETPFVGIGMHPEQQANIDACVRKGFAIRLSKKRVTPDQVIDSVDSLLHDKEAHRKIKEFSAELKQWDGPSTAVEVLKKIV